MDRKRERLDSYYKNTRKYYKTKKGIVTEIINSQRNRSKLRGHPKPDYTLKDLREWMHSQDNFKELYDNWVDSNYKRSLKPSIDRLNDYEGYSFDNIQLITWGENGIKSHSDKISGINNKQSKAILQYSKKGIFIKEYHSMSEAFRDLGVDQSSISKCCKGKIKYAGGFTWKYK